MAKTLLCMAVLLGVFMSSNAMGRFKLRQFCEDRDDENCRENAMRCHGKKSSTEMRDSMSEKWQEKLDQFNECLTENDLPALGLERDPEDMDNEGEEEMSNEGEEENNRNERGRPGGFGRPRGGNGRRRGGSSGGGQRARFGANGPHGNCGGSSNSFFSIWRRIREINETDTELATNVMCCFGQKTEKFDDDRNLVQEKVMEMLEMKFSDDSEVLDIYRENYDQCASEVTDCNLKIFMDCQVNLCVEQLSNN